MFGEKVFSLMKTFPFVQKMLVSPSDFSNSRVGPNNLIKRVRDITGRPVNPDLRVLR